MAFYRFNQTVGFEFFKDVIALVPAFNTIMKDKHYGEQAMIWLLAIHDPRSPYQEKYLKESERIEAINFDQFKKKKIDWQDDELMVRASDALRDHYWDEDVSQLNALNISIREETKLLSNATTSADRLKSSEALQSMNKLRTVLLDNISGKLRNYEFDKIKLKNGKELSWLMRDQQREKIADMGRLNGS